jgi:hypothetical protein
MKVKKRKGMLIIKMNILNPLRKSNSGKNILVATSRGPKNTSVRIDGKPLIVSVNAYSHPDTDDDDRSQRGKKANESQISKKIRGTDLNAAKHRSR